MHVLWSVHVLPSGMMSAQVTSLLAILHALSEKEMSEPITVLVPVRNEAANIRRCLSALAPADEIVVLDSASTDDTARIAAEEFGVTVLQFHYTGEYPKKRQWALNTYDFKHDWVLLVDADEIATDSLWQEIRQVLASPKHDGYLITKQFHFLGRAFQHGGFSHSAVLLLNRHKGRFEETLAELARVCKVLKIL